VSNTGGVVALDVKAVATCDGRLMSLVPFIGVISDSPFYFFAERVVNVKPTVPVVKSHVFVKVWREGDDRTSLESVKSEIELLELAHRNGVPCPGIAAELTGVSITHRHNVYHRLVMDRLASCRVERHDFEAYAASLIMAVQQLHQVGILHCDIKPSNVLWDSATKTAFLVDFGHAQLEVGATSYTGTDGYTGPEVVRGIRPHSRRSDAFSVGRTILEVGGQAVGAARPGVDRVQRVAYLLAQDVPEDRITLADAILLLKAPSAEVSPESVAGMKRKSPVHV
jgi:serine/threonine protein kinase